MQTIALLDAGSGNLRSVERALLAAAASANRRREVRVTRDPDFLARADRIVLPGQGAFAATMAGLSAPGLLEALNEAVLARGKPFLGICVGMQVMMGVGLEHGETAGLGWTPGLCGPLQTRERLPHMGWNLMRPIQGHPLLDAEAQHFYFAHSFTTRPADPAHILAVTDHGGAFPSVIGAANRIGVQFHPEKSQAAGLALLARFVDWSP